MANQWEENVMTAEEDLFEKLKALGYDQGSDVYEVVRSYFYEKIAENLPPSLSGLKH